MINEETYLKEHVGARNPFRVPDGYFDNFASQVMQQLPERQSKARVVSMHRWLSAAACVAVLVVLSLTYYLRQDSPKPEAAVASAAVDNSNNNNTYIDDAVDYVMMDNVEMYACLAEN